MPESPDRIESTGDNVGIRDADGVLRALIAPGSNAPVGVFYHESGEVAGGFGFATDEKAFLVTLTRADGEPVAVVLVRDGVPHVAFLNEDGSPKGGVSFVDGKPLIVRLDASDPLRNCHHLMSNVN